MIFFYVKFFFFGVIIKTPSSGQNCHEVNQSWTLPIIDLLWSVLDHRYLATSDHGGIVTAVDITFGNNDFIGAPEEDVIKLEDFVE